MATSASVRIVKTFSYRGSDRNFSNRYHFDGTTPPDATHWDALFDAIVLVEKTIYCAKASGGAMITGAFGYAPGSDVPVHSKTYTTDGTLSASGLVAAPGDAAALIRYSTADRTSKNHPLYLFNYYHGVMINGIASGKDVVVSTQVTAMTTYAADWITGFSDGTATHHRVGPNGNVATGALVETAVTHRDFPR